MSAIVSSRALRAGGGCPAAARPRCPRPDMVKHVVIATFRFELRNRRSSPPGVRAGVVARSCRSSSEQVEPEPGGGETRIRAATGAEVGAPRSGEPPPRALPAGCSPVGSDPAARAPGRARSRPLIDDRMRGPGHGATNVWVYDERRRVRDDVASRLVALPFVGRVEVVADAASLMSRLATRYARRPASSAPSVPSTPACSAATQALRAYPGLPVLVLGAPDDAESVRAAVAFGARGYLRWDASPIEMGLGLSRLGLRADGVAASRSRPAGVARLERCRAAGRFRADDGALDRPRGHAGRRAVHARDAGAHRHEPGQEQRPDRPRALPVRGHHQDPRPAAVPQARRQGPRRGRRDRLPPRR